MTELVPQRDAIVFAGDFMGAESEEDLYDMLGLGYEASEGEVRDAARDLMAQYHPDRENGDVAAYKTIRQVKDILTGEAFEEPDFLDMEEYQDLVEAEEFFSDDVLDGRVSGLDKLFHGRLRARVEQNRLEEALRDYDEAEGTGYFERYQELQDRRPSGVDERVDLEVEKELLKAEVLGRDVDEAELREAVEDHFDEQEKSVKDAVSVRSTGFGYGSGDKYPDLVEEELTDITAHGDITFVDDESDQDFNLGPGLDQDEGVVRVSMFDDSKVHRDNEVYVKVPEGSVTVEDPGLSGAIQVWEGDVEVDLNTWDSFGVMPPVVNVRAPEVNARSGYEQRGELYVPKARDVEESPEVDLSVEVRDGSVTLEDSRPPNYSFETGGSDSSRKKNQKQDSKSIYSEVDSLLEGKDNDPYKN